MNFTCALECKGIKQLEFIIEGPHYLHMWMIHFSQMIQVVIVNLNNLASVSFNNYTQHLVSVKIYQLLTAKLRQMPMHDSIDIFCESYKTIYTHLQQVLVLQYASTHLVQIISIHLVCANMQRVS